MSQRSGYFVQRHGTATDLPRSYVGARYYASQTRRFTSPDPITVNALRIVNPQRWNQYAYAVKNPLKYVDPDGLDALLINYMDGAFGFGHVGIVALNPDGSWLYGGFNPVNAGQPIDRGMVKAIQSLPRGSIEFGEGGRPTIASLRTLRQHLASVDGKSPEAIRIRHIKTSEAETAALASYIQQNIGSPSGYSAFTNNCLHFCVRGAGGRWHSSASSERNGRGADPRSVLPLLPAGFRGSSG